MGYLQRLLHRKEALHVSGILQDVVYETKSHQFFVILSPECLTETILWEMDRNSILDLACPMDAQPIKACTRLSSSSSVRYLFLQTPFNVAFPDTLSYKVECGTLKYIADRLKLILSDCNESVWLVPATRNGIHQAMSSKKSAFKQHMYIITTILIIVSSLP